MNAKEAFEKLRIGKYDTTEEKVKYQIIVGNALDRLERLDNLMIEKNINVNLLDGFITELGENSKRLEELEEVLSFIKEHVLLEGSVLRADFQWDLDIEENRELLKECLK